MKKQLLLLLAGGALFFTSCQEDEPFLSENANALDQALEATLMTASQGQGLHYFELPEDGLYEEIPQDPLNPITHDKVVLGRLLYHETGIALAPMQPIGKETYSCASCHFADAGFQADRWQGIGDGGAGAGLTRLMDGHYDAEQLDVQPIRSPTTLNVAYQTNMLWNGQFGATGVNVGTEAQWTEDTPKENNHLGFEGVETQAIAGLEVHRQVIDMEALDQYGYRQLFDRAFPQLPSGERYTRESAGLAIAAYERTLLANRAPFQLWIKGYRDAMTERQKRGAILFFDKAGCGECHTGPALNSMAFYGYGMDDLHECPEPVFKADETSVENLGRGGFTGQPQDNYKFKVPQLYNLKDSPFLGHGSSFRSIREVVEYKNNGTPQNDRVPTSQLANSFRPLQLTTDEIDAITDFLENGLHDPYLQRYEPDAIPSGLCFPFNDPQSRIDLDCN